MKAKTGNTFGMPCIVYGLFSTENGEIRYIGQTIKSLKHRLSGHRSSAISTKRNLPVLNWIRKLLAAGHQLQGVVLVPNAVYHETEKKLIAGYRKNGANLLNITSGGEGALGLKFSKECREKQSQRCSAQMRRRWSNPKNIIKQRKASRDSWCNPETRKKRIEAQRKALATPEEQQRASRRSKQIWQRPGHREKMSALRKLQSEQTRSKISAAVTKVWRNELYRERLSRSHSLAWTPERREAARLEGIRRGGLCSRKITEVVTC